MGGALTSDAFRRHSRHADRGDSMPLRPVVLACFAVVLVLRPAKADDFASYQGRLKNEAKEFFAQVLPELNMGQGRCATSTEWLRYSIPREIAAEYFNLTIHADLDPPHHGTKPAEILDPDDQARASFCNKEQAEQVREEARKRLESSSIAEGDQPQFATIAAPAYELTFPIFSEKFDRAVIVAVRQWLTLQRQDQGTIHVNEQFASGDAHIYERRDGRWSSIGIVPLFSAS
jgi:hypothetical protein